MIQKELVRLSIHERKSLQNIRIWPVQAHQVKNFVLQRFPAVRFAFFCDFLIFFKIFNSLLSFSSISIVGEKAM